MCAKRIRLRVCLESFECESSKVPRGPQGVSSAGVRSGLVAGRPGKSGAYSRIRCVSRLTHMGVFCMSFCRCALLLTRNDKSVFA